MRTVPGRAAPNWSGGSGGKGQMSEHQEELQEPALSRLGRGPCQEAHIPAKDHLVPIFWSSGKRLIEGRGIKAKSFLFSTYSLTFVKSSVCFARAWFPTGQDGVHKGSKELEFGLSQSNSLEMMRALKWMITSIYQTCLCTSSPGKLLQELSNGTQTRGCQHTHHGDLLLLHCAQHPLHHDQKEGDFSPKLESLLPAATVTDRICSHHLSPSLRSCSLVSAPAKAVGKPPRETLR